MVNTEHFSAEDCEHAGQRLLHIMLTMYDERVQSASKADSLTAKAMGETVMAVKAGISTFLLIERLPDSSDS